MFHDSYSFKSGISEAIRRDLADVVECALHFKPNPRNWLDIACNDGTLLGNVPENVFRVGVDPLLQFAAEASGCADVVISEFFSRDAVTASISGGRTFDVVTSISMFYDLDDPNTFVSEVGDILAENGVWIIQQNYLPSMLQNRSLDNLSHEHLAYYSMQSLEPLLQRHGLEVVFAELNPINGGCFRTVVSHIGQLQPDPTVQLLRTLEEQSDLSYEEFAEHARDTLDDLRELVYDIKDRGEQVFVYGASTRGAVIWQAAELDVEELPYVVERNPAKVGRYMSAIGAPVISEEEARAMSPEYFLLGPWWLRDDIVEREREYLAKGGKLIIPLPKLEIVDNS